MSREWFGSVLLALLAGFSTAGAQTPPPVPAGRTIEAADGDLVIVPAASRIMTATVNFSLPPSTP